jgi:hypothetical protein
MHDRDYFTITCDNDARYFTLKIKINVDATVGTIMNCINIIHETENKGTVERFLFDAQGYIYGFLLTNGMEVYVPSQLLGEFYAGVNLHAAVNSGAIISTCDWCGPH